MAKTKIDKDDIKRLVENTSNPSSTTSVYSAKYVDDNYATSTDVQTAVASVYKLKGNIANKAALLALTNIKQGDVYNAQNAFTLINGQNVQNVKDGDNIVCLLDAAISEEANWDNLCGNIDYGDLGDMPPATATKVGGIKLLTTPGNSGIIPIQLVESKAYIELLADNIRYAIANDTIINGKRYFLKNKTIIVPDGSVGVPSKYNEGLRINNAPNGYSLIALGTETTTTAAEGLNTDGNQWNIIKHPDGELTISFDSGFDDGNRTGLTLYKNGDIFWKNTKLNLPVGHETIQPLSSMLDTLNNLADGIYQLQASTDTYPDSVCGNIVGTVIPEGTEILRQYTVNAGNQDHKTQIMLIGNKTYRRSGIGNSWNEWERLITCRDMANYVTIDMLETSDGGDLEPDIPVNVSRDTTYHIDGDAKEGKYIIKLMPLFTSPPLEIIETYIAISPESSGEYTIEIQLSDFDIDTRESSSSTTVHFGDYASITIPQGTSFVLLKIYMFENVSRCLIVYTLS